MENQEFWLLVCKVIICLGSVGYIYIFVNKIWKRKKYFKVNIDTRKNGEFWIHFKGEDDDLEAIIRKIELISESSVSANKKIKVEQPSMGSEKTNGSVRGKSIRGTAKQIAEENIFSNHV